MFALLAAASTLGQQIAGSPIAHVLVLIQENRTTDNLFASSVIADGGPFPGADVSQVAIVNGRRIALRPTPFEDPHDPDHSQPSLVAQWDGGKMDGFAQTKVTSAPGMGLPPSDFPFAYVPPAETTVYHLLAHRYALADENFSPRLVPTFPGHVFLAAAQSPPADDPTTAQAWGCDSPAGTTVAMFGAGESATRPGDFPCFDYPTIGDLLARAGVTWKYYAAAPGTMFDDWENVYDAIRHVRYGPAWANVSMPMATVLSDIANCKLPQVAFVTPTWANSDHAGELTNGGPAWVASIYMALLQSARSAEPSCRYYGNTAALVTWDDSGGWYDHVPPPAGPDGTHWGFRVPIVAVSGWAKPGFISHKRRETTSILRFIERNWNLGDLGQRDATDDDLGDMFDYAQSRPIPPLAAEMLARAVRERSPGWDLERSAADTHPVDDE
jgi:phospholipase C